jgi:hypothetical protein
MTMEKPMVKAPHSYGGRSASALRKKIDFDDAL